MDGGGGGHKIWNAIDHDTRARNYGEKQNIRLLVIEKV